MYYLYITPNSNDSRWIIFVLLSDGRPSFLSVDKVFEYVRTTKSRFMLCKKIVVSVDITLKYVDQKFKN